MKIADTANYSSHFPESYAWESIDRITVEDIALDIVRAINKDIQTPDRNLVGGLRSALHIIAQHISV